MLASKGAKVALACAVSLGGSVIAAQAAFADPPGCHVSDPSFSISGSGYLSATGAASCNTRAHRTFTVEVKYQKTLAPDPLVLKSSQSKTSVSYYHTTSGCDDGSAHPYYGRVFFNGDYDYKDTATDDQRSCS